MPDKIRTKARAFEAASICYLRSPPPDASAWRLLGAKTEVYAGTENSSSRGEDGRRGRGMMLAANQRGEVADGWTCFHSTDAKTIQSISTR